MEAIVSPSCASLRWAPSLISVGLLPYPLVRLEFWGDFKLNLEYFPFALPVLQSLKSVGGSVRRVSPFYPFVPACPPKLGERRGKLIEGLVRFSDEKAFLRSWRFPRVFCQAKCTSGSEGAERARSNAPCYRLKF